MARFSVVIPVFNGERTLREAIDSVLAQTLSDFEVVVVDDGSTDRTAEIARGYGPPVTYHRQENGGAAAARNQGVAASAGDWIAFLDADDVWYPDKLAVQASEIARAPGLGFVYSDLDLVDERRKPIRENALTTASARTRRNRTNLAAIAFGGLPFPYPSTVAVRRDVFVRAGGFDPAFRGNYHEDFDAFARVVRITPSRFVRRSLVAYRVGRPAGNGNDPGRNDNWLILLHRLWQLWSDEPEKQAALVEEYARHFAHQGKWNLRSGDLEGARRALRRSIAYRPWLVKSWTRLALSYVPGARDFYRRHKTRRRERRAAE